MYRVRCGVCVVRQCDLFVTRERYEIFTMFRLRLGGWAAIFRPSCGAPERVYDIEKMKFQNTKTMKKTITTMKKALAILAIGIGLAATAHADAFTLGNLVILRVGDGNAALSNSGGALSLLEITKSGALAQTIGISTGSLQISGTASSEGQLGLSPDGSTLTVAGYVPPFGGTGGLSSRSATNAPRGFVTVGAAGIVSASTTLAGTFSGENIRSGVSSGANHWFAGSGTSGGKGLMTYNGTTTSQVAGVNSRNIQIFGDDLYYSTGSGTAGIYKFTGTPIAAASPTAFLTGVAGQGTSPYDFALSSDGLTLYVADDGIGVQRFNFDVNSSTWSLAYNFTNGLGGNRAYGLAVDFGATNTIYWTSPTDVWAVTDFGYSTNATSIYTAEANYALRGLATAPVPEPTTGALIVLSAFAAAAYRFRARRRAEK